MITPSATLPHVPQTERCSVRSHDLTTAHVPVAALHTYHRNPRRGNIQAIARSLQVNGQYRPIVVNTGTHTGRPAEVLAGNHTLMAARELGWDTVAAVHVDVDDHHAAKIVAADNRTADLGNYDTDVLAQLLAELPDLDGTGYETADLDALTPVELPTALADPDHVPDTPDDPISVLGDVWELGPHRLACGDSTDVTVWATLLDGQLADMVWTDPPYGVSYVGKTADALTIENDSLDENGLRDFLRAAFGATYAATREGAAWYVAGPPGPLHLVFGNLLHEFGVLRQTLIWVKDQFVMGRSDYHYKHEPIYYGWTPGAAHHAVPDRTQDSVHEIPRPKANKEHPTMKPIALIERHIANSTDPGQLVVDPFGGSGSTLLAAHLTGRRAALIELDPRYADVICRRYQEATGIKPVRAGVPHDFTGGARG